MKTIYDFDIKDLSGKKVHLEEYKGKVLMIVNTATACGLSGQFNQLQQVYDKYKVQGFEILGFPSADFAGQEPREGDEIKEFCSVNYGVTFPIMEKGKVRGSKAQPIFQFLADKTKILGLKKNYPIWNFQKYLVDRQGQVVDFFAPTTQPEDDKVTAAIEKYLSH